MRVVELKLMQGTVEVQPPHHFSFVTAQKIVKTLQKGCDNVFTTLNPSATLLERFHNFVLSEMSRKIPTI